MEKYLQYNHIDLASDQAFIAWVQGSTSSEDFDWAQWLIDHPEKGSVVEDAKSIVRGIQFKEDAIANQTEDQVWAKIAGNIGRDDKANQNTTSPRNGRIIRWSMLSAVAAVALILLIFNFGGSGDDLIVQTQYAMTEKVMLPDGSFATLNADSELAYDEKTWEEERRINLKGEAFFSVKKGSKFTVKTNNGEVQVLGTSFNVFARDNTLNVHCVTGMVSVKTGKKETILTPKQAVFSEGSKFEFQEKVPDGSERSTWRSGIYVYENSPLQNVISELERQLDVTIDIDAKISKVNYTGSFNASNAETALSEVFWPVGLQFEIDNKTVVVNKK